MLRTNKFVHVVGGRRHSSPLPLPSSSSSLDCDTTTIIITNTFIRTGSNIRLCSIDQNQRINHQYKWTFTNLLVPISIHINMILLLFQMLFCFTFLTLCSIEVIITTLAANAIDVMNNVHERYGLNSAYQLNVFVY